MAPQPLEVCSACGLPAEFDTPYGRFCLEHTEEEMRADDQLWLPQLIGFGSSGLRVG